MYFTLAFDLDLTLCLEENTQRKNVIFETSFSFPPN